MVNKDFKNVNNVFQNHEAAKEGTPLLFGEGPGVRWAQNSRNKTQ